MGLQPGASVGPYEVIGSLGAGGMGEVYRARDARLKRDVALKILPEAFAAEPERLARFQREAEVLASLNHPNIAGILALEETNTGRALVLELVEGETLAERIVRGPVPFDEAMAIATQIADALEAAHEHGIIHRDLKPANVKLRPDGTVKVLDFGLAKLAQQAEAPLTSSSLSLSPTITSPALTTGAGVLMGTAAYMSPEQAKGKAADARSDVWSFGCVLFELITGNRAFAGDDLSDTIANVLKGDPDWSKIPPGTPRGFTRLVKRCLARDRRQRLHGIGDARLDIQELLTASTDEPVATAIRLGPVRRLLPYVLTATIAGALVGGGVWMLRTPPIRETQRFDIVLPEGEELTNTGRHVLAVSPAGTHLVYGANNRLNLRPFDRLEATPIAGTEQGGRSPFFSPDGNWVGFWRDNRLFKVAVTGGGPIAICVVENPNGVSWNEDGTILIGQGPAGVVRVSAEGGTPETVVKLGDGSMAQSPQLLPGGEWILFTHRGSNVAWDEATIVVQSIASGERRVLVTGGRDGRYLPTGHIVYVQAGTLFGVTFDIDRMQTAGGAVPLVRDVRDAGTTTGAVHLAVSPNGTLAYVPGWRFAAQRTPVWLTPDGRETQMGISGPLEAAHAPRLSPDGKRLTIIVNGDLWVYDLEGRPPIRLTHDGAHYSPVWSSDGKRIFFEATEPSPILSLLADGSERRPVPVSPTGHYHPLAASSDGRIIAVELDDETAGRNTDIVSFPMDGKGDKQTLVATTNREGWEGVSLSPDGHWMAYASNATGQQEIWVRPYGRPGAAVRVSPNSGREPLWAKNGKELYYLEGRKVMAVAVDARETFDFKPARLLIESAYTVTNELTNQPPSYDIGLDGRFLLLKPSADDQRFQPIIVVLNWFEELKQLVPAR